MEFQCNRLKMCNLSSFPSWGSVAYPNSMCSRVNIWHCTWKSCQLNVCWSAMVYMVRWLPDKIRGNFLSGRNISLPLGDYLTLGCSEIGKSKRKMFVHLKILKYKGRIWRWVIWFSQDSREKEGVVNTFLVKIFIFVIQQGSRLLFQAQTPSLLAISNSETETAEI